MCVPMLQKPKVGLMMEKESGATLRIAQRKTKANSYISHKGTFVFNFL